MVKPAGPAAFVCEPQSSTAGFKRSVRLEITLKINVKKTDRVRICTAALDSMHFANDCTSKYCSQGLELHTLQTTEAMAYLAPGFGLGALAFKSSH